MLCAPSELRGELRGGELRGAHSSIEMSPISAPLRRSSRSARDLPPADDDGIEPPCSMSASTGSIDARMSGGMLSSLTGPESPKRSRSCTARENGLRLQKRAGLATRIWPGASDVASRTDEISRSTDAPLNWRISSARNASMSPPPPPASPSSASMRTQSDREGDVHAKPDASDGATRSAVVVVAATSSSSARVVGIGRGKCIEIPWDAEIASSRLEILSLPELRLRKALLRCADAISTTLTALTFR